LKDAIIENGRGVVARRSSAIVGRAIIVDETILNKRIRIVQANPSPHKTGIIRYSAICEGRLSGTETINPTGNRTAHKAITYEVRAGGRSVEIQSPPSWGAGVFHELNAIGKSSHGIKVTINIEIVIAIEEQNSSGNDDE
jgi:hypothetical protein